MHQLPKNHGRHFLTFLGKKKDFKEQGTKFFKRGFVGKGHGGKNIRRYAKDFQGEVQNLGLRGCKNIKVRQS